MAYEDLFHAEIGEGIYLISTKKCSPNDEPCSLLPGKATTNSYLAVGEEKALLFDLAVDEAALGEYARDLAGKPLMLVVSHVHYDHVYNLKLYDKVWLHPGDEKLLRSRKLGMKPVRPCPKVEYLRDGETVDLGGRILDVINIPGHTKGSILLLDRKTKILLSGDTGARRLLYGVTEYVPLKDFCADLERLKQRDFDVMYSAHDRCAIPKAHIDTMLDVIKNDLPRAEKTISIPMVGKLVCISRGEETRLSYFDMAMLKRKGKYSDE